MDAIVKLIHPCFKKEDDRSICGDDNLAVVVAFAKIA